MAKRTPEEIQAQREAWLARKTARAAGQDVPPQPLEASAEAAPTVVEAVAEAPAEPEVSPQPVVETPAPEPVAAQPSAPKIAPETPAAKRTPEEIRAQREAFLAAKAAKAAGVAAPPAPKPVEAAPAPAPVAKPVEVETPKPKPRAVEAAPKPAPAKAAPPAEKVDAHITRREFLNYAWLASIALLSLETLGLSLWFAFPNFKEGQFGGAFPIGDAATAVPEVNSGPKAYVDGKFWLINVDTEVKGEPRKGILAIYKVCTHLGCLYDWVPITTRFECPCHGSKFQLSGDYISGPARRNLDRFVIQAIAPDGSVKETDADGNPLQISGDEQLVIDTGRRILGEPVLVPA